jgi:hypothetical protein
MEFHMMSCQIQTAGCQLLSIISAGDATAVPSGPAIPVVCQALFTHPAPSPVVAPGMLALANWARRTNCHAPLMAHNALPIAITLLAAATSAPSRPATGQSSASASSEWELERAGVVLSACKFIHSCLALDAVTGEALLGVGVIDTVLSALDAFPAHELIQRVGHKVQCLVLGTVEEDVSLTVTQPFASLAVSASESALIPEPRVHMEQHTQGKHGHASTGKLNMVKMRRV